MTIRSMTGFGAAQASSQGWTMKVSCRGVNHRNLDVRVWSPGDWSWIEPHVHQAVRDIAHRGRVEVRVDVEQDFTAAGGERFINREVFAAIARELREARQNAGIGAELTVSDVLTFEAAQRSGDTMAPPDETGDFEAVIAAALDDFADSRTAEGSRLVGTLGGLLDSLAASIEAVRDQQGEVVSEYRTRLESRMRAALERYEIDELDERSLLHEVALYADRADVSEEVQRAASHVEKLRQLLDSDPGEPVGKQIDFYLQELIREANTTGSKSTSVAITDEVIAMKSAIEKMREQAANIE